MSCINPIVIKNKNGEYITVPCGHCVGCLNNKAKKMTMLCNLEANKAAEVYFVTLTYNPENLPVASYVSSVYDEKGVPQELTFVNLSARLGAGEIIDQYYFGDYIFDLEKFTRPFVDGKFKLDPAQFGYLCKQDLIKFIKRFRYYYGKFKQVRYFAAGEYGPKSFRPHYHLLFFFESPQSAKFISDCVCKAWTFGRVDCQLSTTARCTGYVSRYVNSFASLPIVLKQKAFKPFSIHSQHFGICPNEPYYRKVENLQYQTIRDRQFSVAGKLTTVSSLSLEVALFPKPYRYGLSSDDWNLRRLRAYTQLSKISGLEKVSDIVSYFKVHEFKDISEYIINSENPESTLTTILYTSRRFERLARCYNVSTWYYFNRIIKPYYENKESYYLSESLRSDEELYSKGDILPINQVFTYGNLPRLQYWEYLHYAQVNDDVKHAFQLFVILSKQLGIRVKTLIQYYYDYKNKYDYEENLNLQNKIHNDQVKHKVINDLNKQLYG